MAPRMTQADHSGRYLMKTRAMRALMRIRYACCNWSGPFQWIQIIPTAPKFQMITPTVG